MRGGAGVAATVDLDEVGVLIAAQGLAREIEAFPYNKICALGHHAKVYQDQRLRKGTALMSLAPLTHHNLTLWMLCRT
jgi:hypothetical protein